MHNMKVWQGCRVALERHDDELWNLDYINTGYKVLKDFLTRLAVTLTRLHHFLLEELWVWDVFWGKTGEYGK